MIKAVIFDLDGTLCDTMEDLLTAMNAMLRSFGWPERTRGELLRFINGARGRLWRIPCRREATARRTTKS